MGRIIGRYINILFKVFYIYVCKKTLNNIFKVFYIYVCACLYLIFVIFTRQQYTNCHLNVFSWFKYSHIL